MPLLAEIAHAARLHRKTPGVTLAAVLALAIGIGANTAIFSLVDTVLLRPLPYERSDRLAIVSEQRVSRSATISVSYPDYLDWRRQTGDVFEAMAARNTETFNLTGLGAPEQVSGSNVSADLFTVLRVRPLLGRVFTADDDRPGAAPVVVLTADAWRRRLGADPGAIGRAITLDAVPRTIVGVLPDGVRYPVNDVHGEIFAPLGQIADDLGGRGSHPGISVIARLRDGRSLAGASAALDTVARRLARQYPDTNQDIRAHLEGYQDRVVGPSRPLLLALWAAVASLLLIACANAAGLLLARAASRTREFAVRLALGATRARLMGQLVVEGLVIAALAGAFGVALASWSLPLLRQLLPETLPRLADIAIDGRVLAFAIVAAAGAGVLSGALPGWQAGRHSIYAATRTAGGAAARRPRLRAALVVGQLALSQAMLVGAGLLVFSFVHLLDRSPGFEPAHAMAAQYYLPDAIYTTYEHIAGFHEETLRRVRALPDVQSAALITPLPFGFGDRQEQYEVEGRRVTGPGDLARADLFYASPDALAALGIPLRAGRFFTARDRRGAPAVAVVDERFERTYFPGAGAVGRRIRAAGSPAWLEIVGVVGHVDAESLSETGRVQVYTPLLAVSLHFASLVVRTRVDPPLAALPAIRREVGRLDADLPLFNTSSMEALVEASTSQARMGALLFTAFAAIALGLAAIGLSGLMAYTVTSRTRELGIRLALGAPPSALVRAVVSGGVRLTAAGLGLGLAIGLAVARTLSALLVGVAPMDPTTFAVATAALAATGLVAAWLPARAASRVDPLEALKAE